VQQPGSDDLWVVEQPGRVVLLDGDGPGRTLIDIRDRVLSGGEQGLLGLAFHPDHASNGRLFLHYTNREGDTRVDEYRARDGVADPASRDELLAVEQPFPNHNGGQLSFGPDGLLYLGLGDGGGANDPDDRAQDLDDPLGKLLRIDVDRAGARWEPVAYGLRNPWRFSWDRETKVLWIADVGQDEREEIDAIAELGEPPPNFGWPAFEGTNGLDDRDPTGPGRLVGPVAEYSHDDGCSVTGGYVYRGSEVPGLRGRYVYGDVCSGILWTLRAGAARADDVRREDEKLEQVSSFGEDRRGELYAISLSGSVSRLSASE
jgi:glucose/arabinose dehydrogenase